MTQKLTEILAFKVDETTFVSIDNLLDCLPRSEYPTRADLLRALLDVGLKKYWKEINKERE